MNCLCRIGGLAYEMEKTAPICEIEELKNDCDLEELFHLRGFSRFSSATRDVFDDVKSSVTATLSRCGLEPNAIDAVVVTSDTLRRHAFFDRIALNRWLMGLGMTRAYVMGLSLADCNNFTMTLQTAGNMVAQGTMKNILVVSVDRVVPNESRLLDLGMSVFSDAVASCVVSNQVGEFDLLAIGHAADPGIDTLDLEKDLRVFFERTLDGVERATNLALESANISLSRVKRLITNNYANHVQKMIVERLGMPWDKYFTRNVSRFGHAYSADLLINLRDASDAGEFDDGGPLLMIGNSPSCWGASILKKR